MTIPILGDGLPNLFFELTGHEFEVLALPIDGNASTADCQRAVGVIAYSHPHIGAELMDRMPNLKVISNHGVGVDHIDVAAAEQRNIPVGNTPGCLDASTADMTMALMLAAARNVVIGDHHARCPEFTHYDPAILIGQEVTGCSLGIIGMGRIGKQVARRAAAFDMKILYHNRNRDTAAEQDLPVEYAELDTLLSTCDFVSLNCPLTAETTGLIGSREFALMKNSAILINMARGPVVNTADLYTALTTHQIAVAALDVTDPEPLPRDHPLLKLDNVIIAPHLGSASNLTRRRMMELSLDNLRAGLTGEDLPNRIRTN